MGKRGWKGGRESFTGEMSAEDLGQSSKISLKGYLYYPPPHKVEGAACARALGFKSTVMSAQLGGMKFIKLLLLYGWSKVGVS